MSVAVLVLAAVQLLPAWPGLVQFVALPPLDLVADIRALLVYGSGGVTFVAALVLLVAVRAAVIALLLGGLTWERYWFALRFYLLVLPFAAVAAAFIYTAQATLFYGAFWAGLGLALLLAVLTSPLPWLGPPRLRESARQSTPAPSQSSIQTSHMPRSCMKRSSGFWMVSRSGHVRHGGTSLVRL